MLDRFKNGILNYENGDYQLNTKSEKGVTRVHPDLDKEDIRCLSSKYLKISVNARISPTQAKLPDSKTRREYTETCPSLILNGPILLP